MNMRTKNSHSVLVFSVETASVTSTFTTTLQTGGKHTVCVHTHSHTKCEVNIPSHSHHCSGSDSGLQHGFPPNNTFTRRFLGRSSRTTSTQSWRLRFFHSGLSIWSPSNPNWKGGAGGQGARRRRSHAFFTFFPCFVVLALLGD